MALGAYEAFSALGRTNKVHFIGVDGLAGENGGMQLVREEILDATLLYPTGGGESIRLALDILNGKRYNKENTLQTTVIDKHNVRVMLMQAGKINDQQVMIEREQYKINDLNNLYARQRSYLLVLMISLIGAILTGVYIFYLLRSKQQINKLLTAQNIENLHQKNLIAEIATREEEAIQAKLQFFTNISHEFRTPLTLMLTPLEELLRLPIIANNKGIFQDLSLVQKNALRLLRLVTQLMDFRKMESGQMKVSVSENNIVDFTRQIFQAFEKTAAHRHIDFRLISNRPTILAWIDVNMLDKVLFNLLSNAFKFTKDHGKIFLKIVQDEKRQLIEIKVEDNGVGMSEETGSKVFERFYQGDNQKKYLGTGIGLALSKEFIELLHGTLSVESNLNEGTIFTVHLNMGNAHFAINEILQTSPPIEQLEAMGLMHSSVLQAEVKDLNAVISQNAVSAPYSLLIVEDNPELSAFLFRKLSPEFEVFLSNNAHDAFTICLEKVPDLVLSDIMIAGLTDGLALVREIKADLRTSHIPVVLISALGNLEEQIGGIQTYADAYFSKPFSFQLLHQTIKTILKNREILRDHFTAEVAGSIRSKQFNSKDKQFVNEFMALIEANYRNPDYSVDRMFKPLSLSRVQLYRKVKALMNCSVAEYLNMVRLQKARHTLSQGEHTIAEVAYESGFSSPAYFSTAFKTKFGISPSEFKKAKAN
jgi:signal transduction histidine kinase/AraC-like DNA-binding protein